MVYHLIMDCSNTESVQSKLSVKGNTTRKPTNLIVLKYQIPVNAISREPDEPFPHDKFFYYIGICFTRCQGWDKLFWWTVKLMILTLSKGKVCMHVGITKLASLKPTKFPMDISLRVHLCGLLLDESSYYSNPLTTFQLGVRVG